MANKPAGNFVGYFVGHFYTATGFFETVYMVPHGVGAKPLLVDKVLLFLNLGYFGYPIGANIGNGRYLVGNYLTCKNICSIVSRGYNKLHLGWSNKWQVGRIRKEMPSLA